MTISPKKSLGQNFILHIPKEILPPWSKIAHKSIEKLIIIEIGPGTGNITKQILKTATPTTTPDSFKPLIDYFAIELDTRLIPILEDLKKQTPANISLHIINQDVLTIDLLNIIQTNISSSTKQDGGITERTTHAKQTEEATPHTTHHTPILTDNLPDNTTSHYSLTANAGLYIFGALPYNISKRIIKWSILQALKVKDAMPEIKLLPMRFIVQKEVAERYADPLENAAASQIKTDFLRLSILPLICYAKILKLLPPGNFYPSPKVTSAIIEIKLCPKRFKRIMNKYGAVADTYTKLWREWEDYLKPIKQFYNFRRKTLKASLQKIIKTLRRQGNSPNNYIEPLATFTEQGENSNEINKILNKRPDELTLKEWFEIIEQMRKKH